ncbi:MAG: hypothetical protein HY321_15680 [Armatimonadetes bacterium]|nr:hypothetical protein [Armatimonadota bacterium]
MEDPSPCLVVKDADGAELDSIPESELPDLANVAWSPVDDRFCFTAASEEETYLYVYTVAERRYRQVGGGPAILPQWSPDGRYLACVRKEDPPAKVPSRLRWRHGPILALDARSDFRPAFTADGLCTDPCSSPDSARLAFERVRKDEFGDYGTRDLCVADLSSGRVRELLSSRRRIEWVWASGEALAATTCDRYGVPTLSLLHLDGTRAPLVTARDYDRLTPLEYEARAGRVIYRATTGASDWRGELWEARSGRPAARLPADDPAHTRHSREEE